MWIGGIFWWMTRETRYKNKKEKKLSKLKFKIYASGKSWKFYDKKWKVDTLLTFLRKLSLSLSLQFCKCDSVAESYALDVSNCISFHLCSFVDMKLVDLNYSRSSHEPCS